LHIAAGPSREQIETVAPLVAICEGDRFELSDDMWIERLNEELAKHIQEACEPSHYNVGKSDHDRHLYAFIRRVPNPEERRYAGMTDLHGAVALSRLIHPTSTGDRYSALVWDFPSKDSTIQAIRFFGVSPDVVLGREAKNDWLSVEDGEGLRKLMPWLSKGRDMHRRVHRAYWNYDYAMRSYYLDLRWILIVSGLEALVSTRPTDNKRQFRGGVGKLATHFGIALTGSELEDAWKLRSKVVHGEGFLSQLEAHVPTHEHNALYEKLELLLRMTLLKSLQDSDFGESFQNDGSVEKCWQS